jgi:hypothetical protein
MQSLPEPKRLSRRASFVPAAAAKRDAFPPEMRTIAIAVRDLPASLLQQAGVAVYDALDHEVAWLPLAAAKEQDGALHVTTEAPSEQKLRIVVASEFATARNAYWTSVDWPADADKDRTIEVSAASQDITLRCADKDRAIASLLRIRRKGDDRWAPRTAFPNGATVRTDGILALRLGAGSYEISPWATGDHATVTIEVPGPASIDATFVR